MNWDRQVSNDTTFNILCIRLAAIILCTYNQRRSHGWDGRIRTPTPPPLVSRTSIVHVVILRELFSVGQKCTKIDVKFIKFYGQ